MRLRHPHIIALHEVRLAGHAGPAESLPKCTKLVLHPLECCISPAPRSPLVPQVFLTRTHLVLAMEYAAGGDLFRYVSARRGLPEDEARWFFQQLIVAVDYCHRMVRLACSC